MSPRFRLARLPHRARSARRPRATPPTRAHDGFCWRRSSAFTPLACDISARGHAGWRCAFSSASGSSTTMICSPSAASTFQLILPRLLIGVGLNNLLTYRSGSPATSSATSKGISSSAQRRRKASTSSPYSRTTARRRGSVKWWLPQITKSRRFTTQPYVPQYGTPFQLGCCGRSAASVSCAGVSKCRPAVSAFGQTGH